MSDFDIEAMREQAPDAFSKAFKAYTVMQGAKLDYLLREVEAFPWDEQETAFDQAARDLVVEAYGEDKANQFSNADLSRALYAEINKGIYCPAYHWKVARQEIPIDTEEMAIEYDIASKQDIELILDLAAEKFQASDAMNHYLDQLDQYGAKRIEMLNKYGAHWLKKMDVDDRASFEKINLEQARAGCDLELPIREAIDAVHSDNASYFGGELVDAKRRNEFIEEVSDRVTARLLFQRLEAARGFGAENTEVTSGPTTEVGKTVKAGMLDGHEQNRESPLPG